MLKEIVNKDIGNNIQVERKLAGITQAELGEKIGVNIQQMSKYERGKDSVSCWQLFQIAEALGLHPITLLMHDAESITDIKRDLILIKRFLGLKLSEQRALINLVDDLGIGE